MKIDERIAELEEENQKLKKENEILMNIIMQMKQTLNRLLSCYISEIR